LKHGMGTGDDITMLFGALANAAGLDARVALLGDRSDVFFDKRFANTYFLRNDVIAVKVGDDWRFADPAETYVPYGMLEWRYEGQPALIADPKATVWTMTPISPPEKSMEKRTATLRLSEDGTL